MTGDPAVIVVVTTVVEVVLLEEKSNFWLEFESTKPTMLPGRSGKDLFCCAVKMQDYKTFFKG